jgi:hypothetical protein
MSSSVQHSAAIEDCRHVFLFILDSSLTRRKLKEFLVVMDFPWRSGPNRLSMNGVSRRVDADVIQLRFGPTVTIPLATSRKNGISIIPFCSPSPVCLGR